MSLSAALPVAARGYSLQGKFRGRDATVLAESWQLEQVAAWLWTGQEPIEPGTDLAALAEGFAVVTPIRSPAEATDVTFNLESIVVQTPAI